LEERENLQKPKRTQQKSRRFCSRSNQKIRLRRKLIKTQEKEEVCMAIEKLLI
jgi:hypothetical protein